ncbi:hypothetical protein B0F90DRAFT_1802220, partial [Multifurca ochricompacta]
MVEKYKFMRHIKPQHELTYASSDEATGKWHLTDMMETMTRRSRHGWQWDVTEEGEWEEGVKVKDWRDRPSVSLE